MGSLEPRREELARYIAAQAGARRASLLTLSRLGGGAVQENWALEVEIEGGPWAGRYAWVLRTDARSRVAESLTRAQEFAVLQAAFEAGVRVARPLWLCRDLEVIGKEFYLMERAPGIAAGHRVVRELAGRGEALAAQLGENLARIHRIRPPHPALAFLPLPRPRPSRYAIERLRAWLDALDYPHPVLEWGLTWCADNPREREEVVLVHRDFRTGNYLVEGGRLTALLDWEFAGWGDPHEDLGWFCARCWRFGRDDLPAGGIAPRQALYSSYERASGRRIDPEAVHYWEVMAHVRWGVIALQQAKRHLSGAEPSLELALTGRIPAELEQAILELTDSSWRQLP